MGKEYPPNLPAELSRPDAQSVVDALNVRTWQLEKAEKGIVASLPTEGLAAGTTKAIYEAAAGVYWEFLYTGEETYPWAKIGGPALYSEVTAAQTTESLTYTNLATIGPEVTVPFKGDYEVATGFLGVQVGGTVAIALRMSYSIGGTAAGDEDRISIVCQASTGNSNGSRVRRKTGLEASTALVAKYTVSGGKGEFLNRWMRVDPIRVG